MAGLSDAKDKGNQLFKQGDYVGAISAYSVGLDVNIKGMQMPSNRADCIALRTNRALCFLLLKQWDECCRDCTAALVLDPTCFKALYRRAKVCAIAVLLLHLVRFSGV